MQVQVFDSGLIGEGVLHLLAWAHAKLLTPDAILVGNIVARPVRADKCCSPVCTVPSQGLQV